MKAANGPEGPGPRRSIGRREEDRAVRDIVARQALLFNVGQIITSEMDMDVLFEVIIEETNAIMKTERSTVFLHDEKKDQLWSFVATGVGPGRIRIQTREGIAGWVFSRREPLVINDAYCDERFCREVDVETGFSTRNILCIPIINNKGVCIGVLQTLNKVGGDFVPDDLALLTAVSHYVAVALENARLYEELKIHDTAKEKVINHLSHEMKTPLSLITSALSLLQRKILSGDTASLEKTIDRGFRNAKRLLMLQEKMDDILNQRRIEEKTRTLMVVRDAIDFVEEAGEENGGALAALADRIARRIESVYRAPETAIVRIDVDACAERAADRAEVLAQGREVSLVRDFRAAAMVEMDPTVFSKVLSGLLKNAIENTPDEGVVTFSTATDAESVIIAVRDTGVGIRPSLRKLVFGGFMHAQATGNYATKQAYCFNAGGTGSDLLRIRAFAERFGFTVSFESEPCPYTPLETDVCPGRISDCARTPGPDLCRVSGGAIFTVRIPLPKA